MSEQAELTGYDSTEAEEYPEWDEKQLGEIFKNIYSGGTPKKGVEEYYNGDIPFVKIAELNEQQGTGVSTANEHISEVALEETSTRAFDAGTLLLSIYGSLAETAIVRSRVATNQAILGLWDAAEDNVLYIRYAIDSTQAKLESLSRQTTQANIGKGIVEKHRLLVPPLEEQRKIATVLYTVDQAIQKTEEIIEQVDRVQKGLTSRLFANGPRDSKPVSQRLGPVATKLPEHWETTRIGELYAERQLGTSERGSSADSDQIDLIKMGNLDFGTWDFSEVEKIDWDSKLLDELELEKGDLLFNTRNTPELVGKTAVWEFDRDAIYDNNLLRLRFGERISSGSFVNYYLSSELGRRQLRGRVHGTTSVAAIYWSDLQQVEIPVPPKQEQEEIINILSDLDETRRRNKTCSDRLRRLKQGLMQDLLSGAVRTDDVDIAVLDDVLAHG